LYFVLFVYPRTAVAALAAMHVYIRAAAAATHVYARAAAAAAMHVYIRAAHICPIAYTTSITHVVVSDVGIRLTELG
jgi:hypothetical protein